MADLPVHARTPRDMAALLRRQRTAAQPTSPAPPSTDAAAAPWERVAYERAVLASDLHPTARLLAFILTSLAPHTGRIPAEDVPQLQELAVLVRVHRERVWTGMTHLELGGWVTRPPHAQSSDLPRAILLTLPAGHARTPR